MKLGKDTSMLVMLCVYLRYILQCDDLDVALPKICCLRSSRDCSSLVAMTGMASSVRYSSAHLTSTEVTLDFRTSSRANSALHEVSDSRALCWANSFAQVPLAVFFFRVRTSLFLSFSWHLQTFQLQRYTKAGRSFDSASLPICDFWPTYSVQKSVHAK